MKRDKKPNNLIQVYPPPHYCSRTPVKEHNISGFSPISKIEKCLKEFEGSFFNKMTERTRNVKRDLDMKNTHLTLLQKRLTRKANELETKEGQLSLKQQELEIKSIELLKQLQYKDEEIDYIKERYKNEKEQLLKDKEGLNKEILNKNEVISKLQKKIDNLYLDSNVKIIKNKDVDINIENLKNENEQLRKKVFELNKTILILKDKINRFKLNYHREKEEMYSKKIAELDKKVIKYKQGNQTDFSKYNNGHSNLTDFSDFSSIQCDSNTNIKDKKLQVFTFKPDYEKKKSLETLIKEKELLMNCGNYTESDPIIININDMIKKREQELKDKQHRNSYKQSSSKSPSSSSNKYNRGCPNKDN